MCERDYGIRREDIGIPWRYREWYDDSKAPTSPLQVDQRPTPPQVLGPNGRPIARRVHAFGFQAHMRTQE